MEFFRKLIDNILFLFSLPEEAPPSIGTQPWSGTPNEESEEENS